MTRPPATHSSARFLRPRRPARRGHRRTVFGPAFAGDAVALSASEAPPLSLALREVASPARAIASGSLSLAIHAAALAALVFAAWTAPEVVEEIIPVRIIKDARPVPEPAPARRIVAPRRSLAQPARRVATTPQRAPVAPAAAQVTAPRPLTTATIEATAPTPVAAPIANTPSIAPQATAQRTLVATSPQAVAVARFEAPNVVRGDVTAPVVDASGPRALTATAPVAVEAPRGFGDTSAPGGADYRPQASVDGIAGGDATAGEASGVAIDAGTSDALHGTSVAAHTTDGGGGSGGIGTAAGGIPCNERESVHRYMSEIETRVKGEWKRFELPPDLPPNAKVVLAFAIDESGTARDIEVRSAPTEALGESCRRALVAASPFPALEGNQRCLAGRRRIATFTVPVDETYAP